MTTAKSTAITVLCVDDHRLMREGITHILGRYDDVRVVGQASNGREAVELFTQLRPHVTLMDLQMPVMNGLDATRAIRSSDPHARIVVLTMYQGDEDTYRALQAGAVGYLLKDSVPEELIRVIRDVHAGKDAIPPDVAAKLAVRSAQPSLTGRELQVLELLTTGMRNKEIAARLGISEDTVRAHVKGIFSKFQVHDRTAALAEALRRRLVHIDQ
jgi:two-component system, NarL family, response regulator